MSELPPCAEPGCPALATKRDGHCPIHEGGVVYFLGPKWVTCAKCSKRFTNRQKCLRRGSSLYHLKCWAEKQA